KRRKGLMKGTDNTREPNGYFLEDILQQDLLHEHRAREQDRLSESEQRLLAHVSASLKSHIRDEVRYHLTHTFPEMQVEPERQWDLIELVAKTLKAPTDVLMIVRQTVARLAEVGDTPWAVGAYLNVVGTTWRVEIQMNYPYEGILPSGTGRVLF